MEETFTHNGFTSICPESHTLDDQIKYILAADEIAGIAGTLTHMLLFAHKFDKVLYSINKTYFMNWMMFDTLKMLNYKTVFLDFYEARNPTRLGFGPFIFIKNENYDNFVKDYNFSCDLGELNSQQYLGDCISEYIWRYNIINGKNKFNFIIKNDPTDSEYFPLDLYKRWVKYYQHHEMFFGNFLEKYASLQNMAIAAEYNAISVRNLLNTGNEHLIFYEVHLSMDGWLGFMPAESIAGFICKQHYVEAFRIKLVNCTNYIFYQVFYNDEGWSKTAINGQVAGTTGKSRPIDGFKIWLEDLSHSFSVHYRAFTSNWLPWCKDGQEIKSNDHFRAIQIKFLAKKIR